VLRGVLGLYARVPLRVLHALGALLGWAAYLASPSYRRYLRGNLAQAGYHDPRLRREAIESAGRMFAELPAIWLRAREVTLRRMRGVVGEQYVREARARGQGIVYLAPHYGCFEIVGHALAEFAPLTALYRPPKLRWIEPLMIEGRVKGTMRLARADYSGVRDLVAALKRRETVGILPDQVPGVGDGEWVEFFGRPAYTMTLAAKLIGRPDTVGLVVSAERLRAGRGYVLHITPLPESLAGESPVRRINRAIESMLGRDPGQYLWGYNRYKRPRGAEPPPGGAKP